MQIVARSKGTLFVYMEGPLDDMLARMPVCAGILAKSIKDKQEAVAAEEEE